jgi:hypothetical protein
MNLGRFGHLTYSTLVHPGDTWAEAWHSLTTYVPRVKARVSPHAPFGVSLRLSAASADTLTRTSEERRKLRDFLGNNGLYLYTVNAFPYGPFKNTVVKEQVYEPDWRSPERLHYTTQVADILAEVCPPDVNPSIQSPPLGFKARASDAALIETYAANIRSFASHLHRLESETGRCVTLALEPEPLCVLETTQETVRFFDQALHSEASLQKLARQIGGTTEGAREVLRRHVGTVYDICHQAVEFEDITASLQLLADHEIAVFKLQEAAAVRIPRVDAAAVEALRPYADSVYLTQTVECRDGRLTRFPNLQDAFASFVSAPKGEREWRTHFHVPVFLDRLGEHFGTTRFAIEEALAFHCAHPVSAHLEIETYTWDVLPEQLKSGDIVDYIVREIEWVRAQLAKAPAASATPAAPAA